MWIKSEYRMNEGQLSIYDKDAPEDKSRCVWVYPEVKPKKGQGFGYIDDYSDKLANDIVTFLNQRDYK